MLHGHVNCTVAAIRNEQIDPRHNLVIGKEGRVLGVSPRHGGWRPL
jgi:hypothetical protein